MNGRLLAISKLCDMDVASCAAVSLADTASNQASPPALPSDTLGHSRVLQQANLRHWITHAEQAQGHVTTLPSDMFSLISTSNPYQARKIPGVITKRRKEMPESIRLLHSPTRLRETESRMQDVCPTLALGRLDPRCLSFLQWPSFSKSLDPPAQSHDCHPTR